MTLPAATYPSLASQTQFFRQYVERVQAEPGILSAGAVSFAPLTRSGFGGSFTIYDRPESASEGNAQVRSVTPGYMETLAIPLRAGRLVDARDTETAPRVALVSEAAARRFWPGENPVGKRIRVHVNETVKAPREIIGVVGDVRTRGMETAPVPVIYVPHAQYGPESMIVVARTSSEPLAAVPQLTVGAQGDRTRRRAQPAAHDGRRGVGVGGGAALPDAAALGLRDRLRWRWPRSVSTAWSPSRSTSGARSSDCGWRSARIPADVLRLVMREGMRPVAAGILVGLGGAALLARVMKTLLFGVDTLDPVTFGAVATALACVALAACYVPARRAMAVDPAHTPQIASEGAARSDSPARL